ncbi:uncharacterized protein LOC108912018 [Anoplophora glabripennis]|uniref:uncharacterized protein LOC108912018 n=1 Tax=Anoplophora glabripennis TaxID=217634 RepID=UPI0008750469|nr:uncharacterized protein LOC108912018 [Anoplophora glabripennis]
MEQINVLSESGILKAMENEFYLNWSNCTFTDNSLSAVDVKSKILEFSKFLNSAGKLSLLSYNRSESEEFVPLLLTLKKNIKYILSEIGHSHSEKKYEYICCECNEVINIDSKQNFWACLQNHEHVEYLYSKFLTGTLDTVSESMTDIAEVQDSIYSNPVAGTSNFEFANENTDSGIDNEICEGDHNEVSEFTEKNECKEDDVNNFRFNFVLKYDDAIEIKLYPERLMKTVWKIDRIKEYTIQKTGPFRAVCLLCSCDLVAKTKISKFAIEDHTIGQRHLRNAGSSENVNNLRNYHDFWLNLEATYQSHQVYFKPNFSAFKCVLCNLAVKYEDVLLHIQRDPHKKKVLDLFKKNSNIYYLIELHVQIYGVTMVQVESTDKEVKKEMMTVKPKVRTEKTDSDSSPSSDTKEVKHNIIKSVENFASDNVLDLIPNRFREHIKYLKSKGNMISCDLCKITLLKEIEIIKKHIKLASHVKASNIKPKKYNYYCEICNIKIPDEVAWNSHFNDGPNKHANMAESRKNKTTEYECTKCCTVIYGDDLSLTRHLSVKRGKRSKELKLPEPVNKLFRSKEVIESTANKLTFEANDALRYNQLTKECCTRLEVALGVVFEGCRAYPFGSRISGLGDQYSDLDVFIDTGGMYLGYKNQDALAQVQLVRKAAGILSKHKEEFQDFLQIPTARTPIVKLYHKMTDIECDLSFRHGLSVENTKFLRFCLDLQPITQPFVLLLKKWSQHNNFTEHISTYALALTAIFYLQVNNYLLSVKKLRELNPEPSLVIDGWETIKYTMPLEKMKTFVDPYPHSITNLLKDFFGYYAKFKYSEEVICPLLGRTILKKQFFEGTLPEEMKSYILQLQGEEPEQFRAMSSICIQDPFDLSHNLTKACQPGTLNKFKTFCELSFKLLESTV